MDSVLKDGVDFTMLVMNCASWRSRARTILRWSARAITATTLVRPATELA
jgi:hypothetical protein